MPRVFTRRLCGVGVLVVDRVGSDLPERLDALLPPSDTGAGLEPVVGYMVDRAGTPGSGLSVWRGRGARPGGGHRRRGRPLAEGRHRRHRRAALAGRPLRSRRRGRVARAGDPRARAQHDGQVDTGGRPGAVGRRLLFGRVRRRRRRGPGPPLRARARAPRPPRRDVGLCRGRPPGLAIPCPPRSWCAPRTTPAHAGGRR